MGTTEELNTDTWVDEYGDILFFFAKARINDRSTAEDLVQETFLAALRSKKQCRGKSSVKTWLFGILKHKIIDHYRKKNILIPVQDFAEDADHMESFFNIKGAWQIKPKHWSSNPGKVHETKEFMTLFFQCLSGLPGRTAEAFAQREIEGLDTSDICRRLDITAGNCRVLLYRARMLLRKCLEGFGFNQNENGDKS